MKVGGDGFVVGWLKSEIGVSFYRYFCIFYYS